MEEELDLEHTEARVESLVDGEEKVEFLKSLIEKRSGEREVSYLRLLLFESLQRSSQAGLSEIVTPLETIVKSASATGSSDSELLVFIHAALKLHELGTSNVRKVILANLEFIRTNIGQARLDLLVPPKDEQGRRLPPQPIRKPPPAPVGKMVHQLKEGSRVLQGYTPGWVAEEYAKKHGL